MSHLLNPVDPFAAVFLAYLLGVLSALLMMAYGKYVEHRARHAG